MVHLEAHPRHVFADGQLYVRTVIGFIPQCLGLVALRTRAPAQGMVFGWARWPLIAFSFLGVRVSCVLTQAGPLPAEDCIGRGLRRARLVGVLSVARPPNPSKWGAAATVRLEASPISYGGADKGNVSGGRRGCRCSGMANQPRFGGRRLWPTLKQPNFICL